MSVYLLLILMIMAHTQRNCPIIPSCPPQRKAESRINIQVGQSHNAPYVWPHDKYYVSSGHHASKNTLDSQEGNHLSNGDTETVHNSANDTVSQQRADGPAILQCCLCTRKKVMSAPVSEWLSKKGRNLLQSSCALCSFAWNLVE